VSIACGGLHNAVCTEEGLVYTWGCGDDGSLGRYVTHILAHSLTSPLTLTLGRIGDENFPILVEGLANETIIRVACGDGQTLAVSTTGDVWGWGTYKDKEGKTWFNPSADSTKIQKQQKEPIKIMVPSLPPFDSSHPSSSLGHLLQCRGCCLWKCTQSGPLL
jgi:regulator of chromosome condensation